MIDDETRAKLIKEEEEKKNNTTTKNHVDNSNESDSSKCIGKRKIDFSITRETGKIIHSSETIPLDSLLANVIGATIGNCPKDGDKFKFNLNIEEDGSIDLQIHAPNNKINNEIVSKLVDVLSDDTKLNSDMIKSIHTIAMNVRALMGQTSSGPSSPWGSHRL